MNERFSWKTNFDRSLNFNFNFHQFSFNRSFIGKKFGAIDEDINRYAFKDISLQISADYKSLISSFHRFVKSELHNCFPTQLNSDKFSISFQFSFQLIRKTKVKAEIK